MKLKIYFIIFINLLNISNIVSIDVLYTPIEQYESQVFDSNDGIILFLDLSKFQINDDIFYYFEFNETDALDDNEESLITFYESHIYEINQEDENIVSKYIDSRYINTYQTIESKSKFYFISSKKNESNYLLIGLSSKLTIQNQFRFKNTKKDESSKSSELTEIWDAILFVVIVGSVIFAVILRACKKTKKKNEKDNTQKENKQEGQNVRQTEYSKEGLNVQHTSQEDKKIHQKQKSKERQIVLQTEEINPIQIYSQKNFDEINI